MERPDFLKSGEIARLIPVISDSRKEQRAASALLSVFQLYPILLMQFCLDLGSLLPKGQK